jgi:N-acetylmuramoyl-L-alanine amidase
MNEPYPQVQINALITLLQWLQQQLPSVRRIAGHQALDTTQEAASDDPSRKIQRKLDPGPLFPWPQIEAAVSWSHTPR